jgi:hypothetical protein
MRDDDVLTAAERRLGRMLRSDDDRVGDVINRALSPERPIRSGGRARLLVAAFIALLAVGTFVWRASAPPPAALTISGSGSVIVVTTEDGRRWLVDERNKSRPHGQYVIAVPQ